jgi:hypothetical protein
MGLDLHDVAAPRHAVQAARQRSKTPIPDLARHNLLIIAKVFACAPLLRMR